MIPNISFFWGLLLLSTGPLNAQPVGARSVSNVRVEADNQRVKIQYDVVGISADDSVYIQVESRSRGRLAASTVTGDVGKGVLPGTGRTIYWDYSLDGVYISDDIQATVFIKSPTLFGNGGAGYALLSALAPGVGTIFVQPNRKIGARPLITAAYGGLLAFGLVQRSQSKKHYALYESALTDADYNRANQLHHQYLIAVRTAAVVWVADVVYTFLRGRKNDKSRSVKSRRLFADYVYTTPTLGFQLSF